MTDNQIFELDAPVHDDVEQVAPKSNIQKNDDGTVTVSLSHPITRTLKAQGGEERTESIDTITLRRPNGGDLRAVASLTDTGAQIAAMFKRLSGNDVAVFDRLDVMDALAVQEVIGDFFPASPKTGPNS